MVSSNEGISRWILLIMRNVSVKSCTENQNTHFVFKNPHPPSRKSCRLWDNVGKSFRAGQATDENRAHANYMLDNWGYRYTLRICNTYCYTRLQCVRKSTSFLRYTLRWLSCCTILPTNLNWSLHASRAAGGGSATMQSGPYLLQRIDHANTCPTPGVHQMVPHS